jgi:uncharacterized membrane protein
VFLGYFGHFDIFDGVLVILLFRRYFAGFLWDYFGGFMSILSNFEVDELVYSIFSGNWFSETILQLSILNFTIKVNYFPLTKFSGVTKHLKMIYFLEIILRARNTSLQQVLLSLVVCQVPTRQGASVRQTKPEAEFTS